MTTQTCPFQDVPIRAVKSRTLFAMGEVANDGAMSAVAVATFLAKPKERPCIVCTPLPKRRSKSC